MLDIDRKDRKILYYLNQNSRQGFSKIAKAVGLSKNAVTYRVERLQKMGIIKGFTAMISIASLGVNTFDLLIKLKVRPDEEKEVLNFLSKHKNTLWLEKLSGEWDLLLEIVIKDMIDFRNVLNEILNRVGDKIDNYETHLDIDTIKVVPIVEDFIEDLNLKEKIPTIRDKEMAEYDDKDKKILFELSKDGLMPQYKLAEKIGLSTDAVRYRMKKLERSGIISTHAPSIDMTDLGYHTFLSIIDLRNATEEELQKLKNYLLHNKYIQYAFRGATKFEIVFFAGVKKPEVMDDLIKEIKNNYFDIIQNIRYMRTLGSEKFTLFPEVLLEL